jgi:hypothetical protein
MPPAQHDKVLPTAKNNISDKNPYTKSLEIMQAIYVTQGFMFR